jgi:hypothetical protein
MSRLEDVRQALIDLLGPTQVISEAAQLALCIAWTGCARRGVIATASDSVSRLVAWSVHSGRLMFRHWCSGPKLHTEPLSPMVVARG